MKLDGVTYGEAPLGFVTAQAATPLRENVTYEAFGVGSTTGIFGASAAGGARFTHRDGTWWQPSGSR